MKGEERLEREKKDIGGILKKKILIRFFLFNLFYKYFLKKYFVCI
jgi:hypothetical protein